MLARAGLLTGESWVTADEAYGQNPTFRAWLADHEVPFVLARRRADSANEIRRLLAALVLTPLTYIDHVMHWSRWRREPAPSPRLPLLTARPPTTTLTECRCSTTRRL